MNRLALAIATLALGLAVPAFAQKQTKTAPPAPGKQKVVAPTKATPAKSTTIAAPSHKVDAKTMKKGQEGKQAKKPHQKAHVRHSGKSTGKHTVAAKNSPKGIKTTVEPSKKRPVLKMKSSAAHKPMRSTVNRQ
jgi:hypothetical protein